MAATVLRTPINTIVASLVENLAAVASLSQVRIKLWPDDDTLPAMADGDNDLVLQISGPDPSEPHVTGSGRIDTRIKRYAILTLRTRFGGIDKADDATRRLTDSSNGHYILEEAVVDAMQLFWPVDVNNNELLIEPARLVPSDGTERMPRSPQWTASQFRFEFIYEASLNQSIQ